MTRPALLSLAALLLALAGGLALHGDVPRPALGPPCSARGTIIGKVTWRRAPAGKEGVADVIVWVQREGGRAFTLEEDDLDPARAGWQREVVMNVSRESFAPRTVVLFPAYRARGGKDLIRTRQNFAFRAHDRNPQMTAAVGVSSARAGYQTRVLPPGQLTRFELLPEPTPFNVRQLLPPQGVAFGWAFDHPFAAVTNSRGEFLIKNVPAGLPLRIQAWRPETGWLSRFGRAGDPIDVTAGRTLECLFTIDR
jgi:hypothetical protein